ncbi:MAG: PorT family protein [Muribaculaceae bacterium]|nr:PorT family protein [Muribaculaceae bacterium]
MKRFYSIIVALIAMAVALPAFSQFRYGPTASVDISTLRFKQDLIQVDQAVGYSGGIAAEMMFPGIGIGLDLGLRYQQRGAILHLGDRLIWSSQGYGTERSYLHFIDIPIHLKFKYTRLNGVENVIAPFVFAGPTFSILAAHNRVDALQYAGGEVGIQFGLGAELCTKWQISASYDLGMTYTLKTKMLSNFSARSGMWDVRVTYLF